MKSALTVRYAIAVVGGGLWSAAFPRASVAGFAWIVPAVLLVSALGSGAKQSFLLGYTAGLVHYLTSLYWLLYNPFPVGALAGWIALSSYLALYPAVWVWVCVKMLGGRVSSSSSGSIGGKSREGWVTGLVKVVEAGWAGRVLWSAACGAIWVALEMVRARLLTGFPWNPLGASQQPLVALIQISSVTGVYGVSFIVAWSSVCILCAAATLIVRTSNPGRTAGGDSTKAVGTTSCGISGSGHGPGIVVAGMVGDIIFPLLAVLSMTYWGACKVSSQPAPVRELGVALVQPSIPQRVVFDPRESTNRFQAILKLTELALATRPDLLVWPEASLPSFEPSHLQVLTNLIAQHRVWMVFGADDAVPRPGTDPEESTFDYFNSAFLFDPNGCFAAAYRKRHLVAFGEYIPLERVLPFMKYLTPVKTSFTPGPGPVRFKLDNPRAVISALICFEDVLPHLVREHVDPDTDFLLNLTNDAWFGESAAQWQHAVNAAFRAVENGLPLVRCTNNGLTCWIDACGRLRNVGFASQSDVYAPGFKTVRVPLLSNGERRALTFYTKHGDVFGWVCVLLAIGASSRVILSNGWKNSARGSCSVS